MFVAYYLCFTKRRCFLARGKGGWAFPYARTTDMSKRVFLALLLCVLLAGIAAGAAADIKPISVKMELSTNTFTGPDDVTVSIRVSNVGDDDLPGSVYLYYPDGKAVTGFGDGGAATLKIGGYETWQGTWHVTQRQLEAGKITFQVKYPVPDENGNINYKSEYYNKTIVYNGAVPGLKVTRSFSSTMAQKGQAVTITYDLLNTGNVTLNSIKVTENKAISSKAVTVDSLAPNESKQVTFNVTMDTKDLVSSAKVTYKAAGSSDQQTQTVDAATISYGESKLTASLTTSAKGVNVGETVKLTLTLKNEGTINYTNLSVTDPTLGEVFSNQELAAGASKTLEKEVTMLASGDYQFTVKATDSTGQAVSTTTDKLTVTAMDPNKKLVLTVNAEADSLEVYSEPAQVRFTVTVTNTSETDATNVAIMHGATPFYTFSSIKAGETKKTTRDASISMAGKFQFTAVTKDLLGNSVSFQSNALTLSYAMPTPMVTTVPQQSPAPPELEPLPKNADLPSFFGMTKNLSAVFLVASLLLLAASLVLVLVALVRRAALKQQSKSALDHLERGTRRDYTAPGEVPEDAGSMDDGRSGDPGEPDAEPIFAINEEELPHMKYVRGDVSPEGEEPDTESDSDDLPKAEEARPISEEEAALLSGGTGQYRLTRPAKKPDEHEPVIAASYARRRRTAKTSSDDKPVDM